MATVPAYVFVTDTQMRVLEASPRWLAAFGLTLEEARGRSVYELAPDYFEQFRPVYDRCLAGEQIQGNRLAGPAGAGNPLYMRAELTPWRDASGQVAGLISAALDITEMVEALERTER